MVSLWAFLQNKIYDEKTFVIVDVTNVRFLSMNLATKMTNTQPFVPCFPATTYSIVKPNNDTYWAIFTRMFNVTYVLSASMVFKPITTSINTYVPNFYEKCSIIPSGCKFNNAISMNAKYIMISCHF